MFALGLGTGSRRDRRAVAGPVLAILGVAALLGALGLLAAYTFWAPLAVADLVHEGVTDAPLLTVIDWQTRWRAVYLAIGVMTAIGLAVGAAGPGPKRTKHGPSP